MLPSSLLVSFLNIKPSNITESSESDLLIATLASLDISIKVFNSSILLFFKLFILVFLFFVFIFFDLIFLLFYFLDNKGACDQSHNT